MQQRGWRVHWAWLPAALVCAAIGWSRYGWWTCLLIATGLGVGVYAELRARRRRAEARDQPAPPP